MALGYTILLWFVDVVCFDMMFVVLVVDILLLCACVCVRALIVIEQVPPFMCSITYTHTYIVVRYLFLSLYYRCTLTKETLFPCIIISRMKYFPCNPEVSIAAYGIVLLYPNI